MQYYSRSVMWVGGQSGGFKDKEKKVLQFTMRQWMWKRKKVELITNFDVCEDRNGTDGVY